MIFHRPICPACADEAARIHNKLMAPLSCQEILASGPQGAEASGYMTLQMQVTEQHMLHGSPNTGLKLHHECVSSHIRMPAKRSESQLNIKLLQACNAAPTSAATVPSDQKRRLLKLAMAIHPVAQALCMIKLSEPRANCLLGLEPDSA